MGRATRSRLGAFIVSCALVAGCDIERRLPPAPSSEDAGPKVLSAEDADARALAICKKLVTAGVASNCAPKRGGTAYGEVRFDLDDFAATRGAGYVRQFRSADWYDRMECSGHNGLMPSAAEAGDLPGTIGYCAKKALVDIEWSWNPTSEEDSSPAWLKCRKTKTPAQCAKDEPAEYQRFKALVDATKWALDTL